MNGNRKSGGAGVLFCRNRERVRPAFVFTAGKLFRRKDIGPLRRGIFEKGIQRRIASTKSAAQIRQPRDKAEFQPESQGKRFEKPLHRGFPGTAAVTEERRRIFHGGPTLVFFRMNQSLFPGSTGSTAHTIKEEKPFVNLFSRKNLKKTKRNAIIFRKEALYCSVLSFFSF